ncbi:MAG TPA: glycosyltransferase family 4 protein [Bdellovibrionota bacterium]|nr:glycosyltransferase family 4 protein [Bdellovibrionota bacterium]
MKIAIVTSEFEGLTRNAGIGTAYRNLGELLLARGHEVTVVFMPIGLRAGETPKNFRRLLMRWKARRARMTALGFSVVIPAPDSVLGYLGPVGYLLGRSHLAYEYLRSRRFDRVHAPDNGGLLFMCLQARKLGAEFQDTRFVIGAHGPRVWVDELNGCASEASVLASHFDRCSIEMADQLVSPSRYMLEHLRSRGWALPSDSRVIPNANRLGSRLPPSPHRTLKAPTIVFFGRLETRKGVDLFAEATLRLLRRRPELGARAPVRLVFLGKDPDPARPATPRLREHFAPFGERVELRFHGGLSSEKSLALLRSFPGAVVCMPSLCDNSPYVLVEAIEAGLNVVATRSGGQAELVHPADRAKALCDPEAASLSVMIERRLSSPSFRVRPSSLALQANRKWLELHRARGPRSRRSHPVSSMPTVSIVLQSRSGRWLSSLVSALSQDYRNLEICVPKSDRLLLPEKTSSIRFREYDPRRRSTPWHSAVSAAQGKYVVFLQTSFARRNSVSEWVRSAETFAHGDPAHVVTCGVQNRRGLAVDPFALWDRRWLLKTCLRPAGVSFANERAIMRLYSALLLQGKKIGVFPEVVLRG